MTFLYFGLTMEEWDSPETAYRTFVGPLPKVREDDLFERRRILLKWGREEGLVDG